MSLLHHVTVIDRTSSIETLADLRHSGELNFVLVNYELAWRRLKLFLIPWDMLIVDECHRAKHHSSRQSKVVGMIARLAKYRLGLTGTPIESDEVDLWAQMRFIEPSLLGDDWPRFRRTYMRRGGFHRHEWKLKKHKAREIQRIVAPRVIRIEQNDMFDLPPALDYEIPFTLTGKAAKAYADLEHDLFTELDGRMIATPRRVTQLIRLQQLTGGFLHTEDETIALEQDKLATMYDWLQDYPKHKKLVIVARFTDELDAIDRTIQRDHAVLDGRTRDREVWQRFQDKPRPEVLIMQTAVGAESIDLTAADTMILYSSEFSWIRYSQIKKRVNRLGQQRKTRFIHLIGENTVDEDVVAALRQKSRTTSVILQHLKRRHRYGQVHQENPARPGVPEVRHPRSGEGTRDQGRQRAREAAEYEDQEGRPQLRLQERRRRQGDGEEARCVIPSNPKEKGRSGVTWRPLE
jgi:SNF2 family DNA or RNA helicase